MPFDRDRLKSRRIDMGITLQEVADAIGVEKPTVQRYESGKINKIDTITVEKLASAIKCSPAYLMGWQSTPQVEQENNYNLSAHEKAVISAYRKTPEMQVAIDRILNITTEQEKFISERTDYIKNNALPFAAAGGDRVVETVLPNDDDQEKAALHAKLDEAIAKEKKRKFQASSAKESDAG